MAPKVTQMQNGLPAAVNQAINDKKEYRGKQLTILSFPIWSTIRFAAALAAGPPVVATIAATPRVAFSYGVGLDMAAAGRAGVLATNADTNLQQNGATRDQADVFIYGISAYATQDSEPGLMGSLFRETDVQIATNGDTTIPLGTMDMFPSPGGLFGSGSSSLLIPSLENAGGVDGGEGGHLGFVNNGNPTSGSFFRLDFPVFWSGIGGGADSNLALTCTPRRAIVKTSALARVAAPGGAAGPVEVFTPITAPLAFVDVRWRLHAVSVRVRSANA